MEEVAVAVQHRVPFVLVMLKNAYVGLIHPIDKINECEPVLDGSCERAGEVVGALPERD